MPPHLALLGLRRAQETPKVRSWPCFEHGEDDGQEEQHGGSAAEPRKKSTIAEPWRALGRQLKSDFSGWPVLLLCAFLGARQLSIFWVDVPVTSCAADMPLIERTDSLFDEASRLSFLKTAVHHPLSASNQLSQQFVGSRGFVLKFNKDGAAQLSERSDLSSSSRPSSARCVTLTPTPLC